MFEKTMTQELMDLLEAPANEMFPGEEKMIDKWPFPEEIKPYAIAYWLNGVSETLNKKFESTNREFNVAYGIDEKKQRHLILFCLARDMEDTATQASA